LEICAAGGLFALDRRSLRSVRQQVKALEDVGGGIVQSGRDVLTKPLARKK
jgi:hypothetical protein